MATERRTAVLQKWPCYLADMALMVTAALVFLRANPVHVSHVLMVIVCFAVGAFLSVLANILPGPADVLPDSQAPQDKVTELDMNPDSLAEIAVLAWRVVKRAEKQPEANRVILRNSSKILDHLATLGVSIVSYTGKRIDVGSNVQILDAVEGEYNRVTEESDPEIQVNGRLVRRAIVTVGRGTPAACKATPTPPPKSDATTAP